MSTIRPFLVALALVMVTLVVLVDSKKAVESRNHRELAGWTRSRRATVVRWDWQIDALKCSLTMLSNQVAHYHNNRLMCCGLWKIKSMIKDMAQSCEKPTEALAVFDNLIDENLIYSDFSRSLIGDQNLNCDHYPEGATACDTLFVMIYLFFILLALFLIFVIVGFVFSLVQWIRWRRNFVHLLAQAEDHMAGGDGTDSEKARFLTDGRRKLQTRPREGAKKIYDNFLQKPRRKVQNMINFIEEKGNIMTGKVDAPNGRVYSHGHRIGASHNSLESDDSIHMSTISGGKRNPTTAAHGGRTNSTATPTTDERCSSSASTESSTVASANLDLHHSNV